MKPLEEYMFFTKSGADNITVINPQGVRSAQCVAKFDITEQPSQEPMVNVSLVSGFVIYFTTILKALRNVSLFVCISSTCKGLNRFLQNLTHKKQKY